MPQIGGLYRLDFMGEAFEQIMREVGNRQVES